MQKKVVLILSYSNVNIDPRIQIQIEALEMHFDLIVCGIEVSNRRDLRGIKLSIPENGTMKKAVNLLKIVTGRTESYYWNMQRKKDFQNLFKLDFDSIIANDLDALPLAVHLSNKKNKPVVFDAHEYYPGTLHEINLGIFHKKIVIPQLCKSYLKEAKFITTVSEGVRNLYRKRFNVDSRIITNAPSYCNFEITPSLSGKIRLVHHGAAIPSRRIEGMIKLFNYLDERFTLDLFLVYSRSHKNYYEMLRKLANNYKGRVNVNEPVKFDEMIRKLNQFDIGLYILPPRNLNSKFSLPNKFFEFIQARLAICIGPSIEMKAYVIKYNLGVVAEDYDPFTISQKLNNLSSSQIDSFKKQSHKYAKELSSEPNKLIWLEIMNNSMQIC
jgi:hypothetical protein